VRLRDGARGRACVRTSEIPDLSITRERLRSGAKNVTYALPKAKKAAHFWAAPRGDFLRYFSMVSPVGIEPTTT
jgi:hypothetical protein